MAGGSVTNLYNKLSHRFQPELGIKCGNTEHITEGYPAFGADLFKNRPRNKSEYVLGPLQQGDEISFFTFVLPDQRVEQT